MTYGYPLPFSPGLGRGAVVGQLFPDNEAYMWSINAEIDAFWEDVVRDVCGARTWFDTSTGTFVEPRPTLRASICKGTRAVPITKEKPKAPAEWRNALSLWMQDWHKFVTEHTKFPRGSEANREDLDVWKKQLDGPGGWREQFARFGGAIITPAPDAPKVTPIIGKGGSLIDIPWTPVLIIGGLIAAGYLFSKAGTASGQIREAVSSSSRPRSGPRSGPRSERADSDSARDSDGSSARMARLAANKRRAAAIQSQRRPASRSANNLRSGTMIQPMTRKNRYLP